ncbi:MAG: hypothetical protein QJQ54_03030 [Mollicutes bacterium]|nr:MAG: hypothetical protein QJQ54_03030 [Mollicutes bacterium]
MDDKKTISNCYHEIKKEKISDIYLFSILETYLFYLEKVFLLKKKDKNLNEIVKIMQKKIYFVMNLEKIAKKINSEKIQILIKKMRKLEYNTKLSNLESKVLIESFFVL